MVILVCSVALQRSRPKYASSGRSTSTAQPPSQPQNQSSAAELKASAIYSCQKESPPKRKQCKEDNIRKSLFTEAQIIGILKQAEAGRMVTDLCHEHGITRATFYRWRSKYGGRKVSDAQERNRLLDKNRRLKQLVADLSLDAQVLKHVLGKK